MSTHQSYKPMLAQEAKLPFTDKNWIFEVKWDGFRAVAYINNKLSLRSRNQKELIDYFPELKELSQQIHGIVLDGEIVILSQGKVNFQALLERSTASSTELLLQTAKMPAAYVVFDILEKDGVPLVDLPLMERKEILKKTVKESAHVILADFVEEKGEAYFNAVLSKGLEGVVAKKKNSKYESGIRSSNWQKIKKLRTCDCVIFGFTKGSGARKNTFGALLLGLYNGENKPVYVGKVGTGFSDELLQDLTFKFQPLHIEAIPFEVELKGEIIWLKPFFVCEVGYQIVTPDGRLRMPRFLRLRLDKQPNDCRIEQIVEETMLKNYSAKRNFIHTIEPLAETKKRIDQTGNGIFVVQEHHSRRLHYDFRLEREGVLKSWAVPKGIPENPDEKRLAVEVEDHPLDYAKFEGEIPEGQYGAGKVVIWDKGTYETKLWSEKMIEVILNGSKLRGRFVLVPLKRAGVKNWLMLKPDK